MRPHQNRASSAATAALALSFLRCLPAQVPTGAAALDPVEVAVTSGAATNTVGVRGSLSYGTVSCFDAQSRRARNSRGVPSFEVGRQIQIRASRRSGSPGRVVLSASLARDPFPATLTLDRTPLSTVPQVVAQDLPLNSTTEHRLELLIPESAPPGPLDIDIIWHTEKK